MNDQKQPSTQETQWLRLLQITSGLASLIGIAGLLALFSSGAHAETGLTPKGFQPGARNFSNPFANPATQPGGQAQAATAPKSAAAPKNGNNFFDDDDSEDEPADTHAASAAPVQNNQAPQGVSMGGTPPSGVISHEQVPNVRIDDETAEGSKEMVTDFNFPDADILDIAKTLGKLTGKNFIYDKDVKGRISVVSNSPITVGDAWRAFLTALDMSGYALIPSGKYIRIAHQRDARDKQVKTYSGDYSPDTDALVTRIFQLKYISSEDVTRTFRQLMPPTTRLVGYEQTNTVIVTDTGSNISKMARMLEILDVEGYDAGIEVIPVKFASAAELAKLVDQLIPGTGSAPGSAPGAGGGFNRGGSFHARRTKEGGIINTIIADERTNTLIVHANSKGADQIRELVAKLDQNRPAPSGSGRVHVRYLQFAEAEKIAATLNNLSSQGANAVHPVTPGGAGTGVNPVAATLFEGAIKVAPDASTNSLVITASPTDFATLDQVISRLDIARDEVYVEAVIMEVDLNKEFDWSANVARPAAGVFLQTSQDLQNFIMNPVPGVGGLIGFKSADSFNALINGVNVPIPNTAALVKLLQTNSKGNVLATPQILTLDNTEATFDSTEKLPVPQSSAVQGAGITTSIGHETVSLTITIKPQISKLSNFVKLDVQTTMGDIDNRSAPAQVAGVPVYATLERKTKTTVVVGDSDTVVIGGLIRDKSSTTVTKIPILGDIPLLGWLFSSKNSTSEKSNLLVFLTPHIIRQYDKIRAILDKKLKERDDFIEKNAGGDDPMRDQRDDIIRSLPDLKELRSRKPVNTAGLDQNETGTPDAQVAPNSDPFTGGKPSDQPQLGGEPFPGGGSEPTPPSQGQPPEAAPQVPPTAPPVPPFQGNGT